VGPKGSGDADAAQLFSQIMNKGSYVTKVQADLAEYGPALDKLAAAVAAFQPSDMQSVIMFVRQAQVQVLDVLYDETAVLKCITDWPAAKWEALWESAVVFKHLAALQQQCSDCCSQQQQLLSAAEPTTTSTTTSSSGSSGSSKGRKGPKGPSRSTLLAAAVSAAQQTFSAVSSKLDAYQRQESGLEKRLRAQGVPWNGPQLVAAVKEAAVQLGVLLVDASLALLWESEQQLLASSADSAAAGSLWGCVVHDAQQQQKLQQQHQRQQRQHEQRRKQQLDEAVNFLFKLHQFSGGFDAQGVEAFCGLADEFQRQQQGPVGAV
jgi:hypothetical protein